MVRWCLGFQNMGRASGERTYEMINSGYLRDTCRRSQTTTHSSSTASPTRIVPLSDLPFPCCSSAPSCPSTTFPTTSPNRRRLSSTSTSGTTTSCQLSLCHIQSRGRSEVTYAVIKVACDSGSREGEGRWIV